VYVNVLPGQALLVPVIVPGVEGIETLNAKERVVLFAHPELDLTVILPVVNAVFTCNEIEVVPCPLMITVLAGATHK
jgi:hypothetical protein